MRAVRGGFENPPLPHWPHGSRRTLSGCRRAHRFASNEFADQALGAARHRVRSGPPALSRLTDNEPADRRAIETIQDLPPTKPGQNDLAVVAAGSEIHVCPIVAGEFGELPYEVGSAVEIVAVVLDDNARSPLAIGVLEHVTLDGLGHRSRQNVTRRKRLHVALHARRRERRSALEPPDRTHCQQHR